MIRYQRKKQSRNKREILLCFSSSISNTNRKHFRRVSINVEKNWKNPKKLQKHSLAARVPTEFLALSNVDICFQNSTETPKCFFLYYTITHAKQEKQETETSQFLQASFKEMSATSNGLNVLVFFSLSSHWPYQLKCTHTEYNVLMLYVTLVLITVGE